MLLITAIITLAYMNDRKGAFELNSLITEVANIKRVLFKTVAFTTSQNSPKAYWVIEE